MHRVWGDWMRKIVGRGLTFLPILLWAGALLYYEGLYRVSLVVLAALAHECGHLLAFSLLGLPAPTLQPVAGGMRLKSSAFLSYKEESIVALGGPLINLLTFMLSWLLPLGWLADFGEISLLSALYNLVPTGALDGERILSSFLGLFCPENVREGVMRTLSFAMLFLALFLSLLLLFLGGNTIYPSALWFGALFALPTDLTKNEENKGKKRKQEKKRGFIDVLAECCEKLV